MKRCPYCLKPPQWFYARRTSEKRKVECFIFSPGVGCPHADGLKSEYPVPKSDMQAREDDWNKEAERLFQVMTEGWTPEQRERFAQKLE